MIDRRRRTLSAAETTRRRWLALAFASLPIAASCARYEQWRERMEDGPLTGSASVRGSSSGSAGVALSVAIEQARLAASIEAAGAVEQRFLVAPLGDASTVIALDKGLVIVSTAYDAGHDRTAITLTTGDEDTRLVASRTVASALGRVTTVRGRARDGEIVVAWIAADRSVEQTQRIGRDSRIEKRSVGALRVRYDLSEVRPATELDQHWVAAASLVAGDVRVAMARAAAGDAHPRAVIVATGGDANVPPAPSIMTVAMPSLDDAGPPKIARNARARPVHAWLWGDAAATPTPFATSIVALEPAPEDRTSIVGPAIVGARVELGATSLKLGSEATRTAPIALLLQGTLGATSIESVSKLDVDLGLPAGAFTISTGDAIATFVRAPFVTRDGELPDDPPLRVRVIRADGTLLTGATGATGATALPGFVPVVSHPTECVDNIPVVSVRWAGGGLTIDPTAPDGDRLLPTLNAATYLERVWTGRLVVWIHGGLERRVCGVDGLVYPKGTF
ncbi:MAG: hypothetical protein ACHREM_26670 [Polyangiales bacterium]